MSALVSVGAGVAAILLGGEGVLVVVDGGHGAGRAAEVCHDVGTDECFKISVSNEGYTEVCNHLEGPY